MSSEENIWRMGRLRPESYPPIEGFQWSDEEQRFISTELQPECEAEPELCEAEAEATQDAELCEAEAEGVAIC